MKDFLEEDYSGLTKIVDETVAESKLNNDGKFFDMIKFRDRMEPEFAKYGFRENENNMIAGGGLITF